ncbi:hypothetical protein GCM10017056_33630 [Seohaeicola zhoushanensis]|uniref:Uncharacterized protein n=1 Tax=Seohaeicola zhoushanensis TaxID=1569283 RepID=A0A8J3H0F1_9RHOB|nr:hypothetical protein GCM10017056_33630 [Seohaeicola zhoushanensis]
MNIRPSGRTLGAGKAVGAVMASDLLGLSLPPILRPVPSSVILNPEILQDHTHRLDLCQSETTPSPTLAR